MVRSVLVKAIKEIGYEVKYEHGGGLNDDRKPGDIIAYNWKRNKNILIDVAMESRSPMKLRDGSKNGPGRKCAKPETA